MRFPIAGVLCVLLLVPALGASVPAGSRQDRGSAASRPTTPGGEAQPANTASVPELESAVKRDPNNAELQLRLGIAYSQQDDFSRARQAFQRAVQIAPGSAEAHNWLGVALLAQSDFAGGIAALRKAIALDPTHGRAYSNLGSALAKRGDLTEAVEVFRKALTLEPNSVAAQMNLGMTLRDKGELDEALAHLRKVVDADPQNAALHYELGQTLRQKSDLTGAVAAFERALAIDPELREGYYALGVALKQQRAATRKPTPSRISPADEHYTRAQDAAGRGELSAAGEQLTKALALDDQHAEAHSLMGFVLGQQGNLPSALGHLERATSIRPEFAEAHYNLGVALWYSGARDRAIRELGESVRLDPAAGASHAFLGTALRTQGDLEPARASLQRAIALLPPTVAVYVDLGVTLLQGGELAKALGQFEAALNAGAPSRPAPDWDSAITRLREAIASRPNTSPATPSRDPAIALLAEAQNVLGLMLGRNGANHTDVADAFRQALELHPDFAEAHNNLGLVLIQAGDDQAGIAALREAVRISPDYADARTNLGAALTPTDAEEGVRELEKAVRLAPSSVNAHFNLGVAYGAAPGHGVAKEVEQLRKVVELAPTFPRARVALGKALLRQAKVGDAITELQEATRLEPESGEAQYQLGLALARAGRKEDAAAALQKGRELVAAGDRKQNASLDITDGRLALQRGDAADAAARFRRAIELLPESSEAHRYLGGALERQGDTAGASASYRKALELNPADLPAKEGLERLERGLASVDDPKAVAELENHIRAGKFTEVEPLLADYVKQRPKSSWGWYALGYSQFAQKKIGESIKALSKSLQLDIRQAEAHKILGRNLMIIGRYDAAQIEFEQAIRYKPRSAENHYNLGKLFSIQDNWEPARKALEAAVALDPEYVEAVDALGFALEALGDDAGAVSQYQKAIALNDGKQGRFASPQVNLSAYYNRVGDADKALEHARRAIELDPTADRAWFQRARAEERRGDLQAAVDALNHAIVQNPRASSYYYVMAGLCRRLGLTEESRKALETFKRLEQESAELDKKRRSSEASSRKRE